ncbi:glycosyl hydrolase family 18 protein [Thalassomonas actiniarum]|uniref:chitinase n=1 Tax=Thalassomonas actiniarum TaxID=485447 RepID=A0AAE9YYM8_9GAMM|nr:glycosyl hydrolase family 18 protein [Thalassomonas actiniarum]WDE01943.1 chitinase [Thalassomonas actiniarum]
MAFTQVKSGVKIGAVISVISAAQAVAAPSTPSLDWQPQNYSFVEVVLDGTGSYKQLVTAKEQVDIKIKWNAWSGSGGDGYKVYFDDVLVNEGSLPAGTKSGTIEFPYKDSGRHTLTMALCEGSDCARSAGKDIVIADTDGGHLAPLVMDIDPNNKTYPKQANTVIGAYFVEWGIYGRDFDVTNIPVDNLTHLLYGFIPICGPNESLKEVENGNSWRALQTACGDSQDYEVVIHDPWAAVQKALPGIDNNDPIRGTYAQLMALKQRNPDLKILPSVGGWTLSDPFYGFTEKANRDTFVASMKQFLKTWKFYDGVDIDWEFPGGDGANPNLGNPATDGAAYVALMQELRAMLDELELESGRSYELTSAIGSGYDKIEDVDYAAASQYMDYIFAMTYDFYGGWNNVTGHQTGVYCGSHLSTDECDGTGLDDNGEPRKGPAYTMDHAAQLLLAQNVSPSKIVLGTAMYGRGWEGVLPANATDIDNPMTAPGNGKLTGSNAEGVWEAGVIDYKGVKANMIGASGTGINGFEVGYDEQAEAAYVWNRTSGKLITYDNPRSVKVKGQYVRQHNFAGLFGWEIDADNGDILNAMNEGLAGGGTDPVNNKPVVNLPANFTVNAGESLIIPVTATDADNDPLTYQWQVDPVFNATGQNTDTLTLTAPTPAQTTDYVISAVVSDGKATVSRDAVVTVVVDTGGNTAPEVSPIADVSIDENSSVDISVTATDAQGDTLSYQWNLPVGISITGSGANVSLSVGEVDADTDFSVSVDVSDGQLTSSRSFTISVKNKDSGNTTWLASEIYVAGNTVMYEGTEYRAKWWTQGDRPDLGGPWEEVVPDDGQIRPWRSDLAYNGGDKVSHNNANYQAGWWTKGEEPGTASVWVKL